MSRVAKNPIQILKGVDINIENGVVKAKGSKGELEFVLPDSVSLTMSEETLNVEYDESNQQSVALAGTTRSLVNNMIMENLN